MILLADLDFAPCFFFFLVSHTLPACHRTYLMSVILSFIIVVRYKHTSVALSDGSVVVLGGLGGYDTTSVRNDAWTSSAIEFQEKMSSTGFSGK
jgi:hypothetical protein